VLHGHTRPDLHRAVAPPCSSPGGASTPVSPARPPSSCLRRRAPDRMRQPGSAATQRRAATAPCSFCCGHRFPMWGRAPVEV